MIYTEGLVTDRFVDVLPKESFGSGAITSYRAAPLQTTVANPLKNVYSAVQPYIGIISLDADGRSRLTPTNAPGSPTSGGPSAVLETERRPELVPFSNAPPAPSSPANEVPKKVEGQMMSAADSAPRKVILPLAVALGFIVLVVGVAGASE